MGMLSLFRRKGSMVRIGQDPYATVVTLKEIHSHSVTIHISTPGRPGLEDDIGLREPFPIGPGTSIKLLEIMDSETIRLGVEAPREVPITRDDR